MDEAFNLATYLVGVGLDRWSYWSDLVIESFSEEDTDECDSGEEDSEDEEMG
jgi:hypothetical protein